MIVIPAIDLKDGQCVRLKQGLMDEATVFSDKPAQTALHWLNQGAKRLHLVDLNGAFAGKLVNLDAITEIITAIDKKIPVQLGGGIRNLDTIEHLLTLGLDYVIIGTAAVTNPNLVKEACTKFPGQIIVGIDAKDGWVATEGWAKTSNKKAIDLALEFEDYGVSSIIYTDIGCDGMLSGVNVDATLDLARNIEIPVIASGGLKDMQDVETLCQVAKEGILGVITGRAIYEGTLDFKKAQELADSFFE
ncbi:1-(5-phosphoribosyl)-5-[(5-phosphoribosylamino)methylideneamino]imidazole-4-carboxamide isomerase [Neisseriaceae bacterium PsAf]|nr:1-(5-phosphoribosyl)-5-[(5-phosphoribosylamino)methylideneamino]imidazole-4-carboxamide isomerase [Neisseriaceae bacterium PsAf]MCV2502527.1 1-(5-phosphoribosyl)-5-[(5-phosphoribosylamino)methylideneamino]imidazole-4-carboxamide isomerase [Neisseriaceae bacterium]